MLGHREDEVVRHDPAVAQKPGKKAQKPDTIIGLRQTRNIGTLLHDTRRSQIGPLAQADERQLHEVLQPSPID